MTIEQLRERRRLAAEYIKTIEDDLLKAETDFAMETCSLQIDQKVTWDHNGAVRFGILKGIRAVVHPRTKEEDMQYQILNIKKDGTAGLVSTLYSSSTKGLKAAE